MAKPRKQPLFATFPKLPQILANFDRFRRSQIPTARLPDLTCKTVCQDAPALGLLSNICRQALHRSRLLRVVFLPDLSDCLVHTPVCLIDVVAEIAQSGFLITMPCFGSRGMPFTRRFFPQLKFTDAE